MSEQKGKVVDRATNQSREVHVTDEELEAQKPAEEILEKKPVESKKK